MRSAQVRLVLISLTIFLLGLTMIFSTTSAELIEGAKEETHSQLIKQLLFAGVGATLAYGLMKLKLEWVLEKSPILINVACVLLVLVLLPGIGREVNGSKRWINLFGFSFQPSEFVKFIVPAFFIHAYLSLKDNSLKTFLKLLGKCAIPIVLIVVEPNNGTALVIAAALCVAFFLLDIPFKYWAIPLALFLFVGVIFASQLPYVTKRLKVYVDPESDLKGKGHQPYQAKIAAGSGGLLGKGPAQSLQKLSYLPEAQNDYIAAIWAEEFGFLGVLALISLYMALGYTAFEIASSADNPAFMAFGGVIAFLITFQSFLNLGVVSGLLPSTGLNLPLFSQGGTSLMANMAGLTLLYQIADKKLCQSAS